MELAARNDVDLATRERADAPLSVLSASSISEVEALRPAWERLHTTELTTDLDYFLTIARYHPDVVRPHVLLLEQDQEPVCIVAAHLHHGWLVHRLGTWAAYKPTLRAINVVYRGVLGDRSTTVVSEALEELRDTLAAREADVLLLRCVEPGSTEHELARSLVPLHCRAHFMPPRPHWSCTLASSLEETLAARSTKTRENARRVARRMEELGPEVRVESFRDGVDAARLFHDIDRVAATTYQRRGSSLYAEHELERRLALLGMAKGWFRAYVLYVRQRPIAFWTGFAYGGTFGRGATGYDPAFRRYSPGIYLLTRMLDDLSRDPAVDVLDLGTGDLEYKRYFGDRRWIEVDVRIFAPAPRPLLINAAGTGVQLLHGGFRQAGMAAGLHGRVSRHFRRRARVRGIKRV